MGEFQDTMGPQPADNANVLGLLAAAVVSVGSARTIDGNLTALRHLSQNTPSCYAAHTQTMADVIWKLSSRDASWKMKLEKCRDQQSSMQIVLEVKERRERRSRKPFQNATGTHAHAERRHRTRKYPSGLHFAGKRLNIKGDIAQNGEKANFDPASVNAASMVHLIQSLQITTLREQGQERRPFHPAHFSPETRRLSLLHRQMVAVVEKSIIRQPAAAP